MEIILGYDRIAWSVRCECSRFDVPLPTKRFLVSTKRKENKSRGGQGGGRWGREREKKIYRCRDLVREGRNTARKTIKQDRMRIPFDFECALNLRTKIGNLSTETDF